jgi:hypothetical protein
MSYVAKGEKDYDATGAQISAPKQHKIRITLTSSNVANLEKCAHLPLPPFLDHELMSSEYACCVCGVAERSIQSPTTSLLVVVTVISA